MTNIINLLSSCCLYDVINSCWKITSSNFFPTKIPKLFIFDSVANMRLTKSAASVIDQPNIIPLSCQNKSVCNIWLMKDPLHHITFQWMDQQNWWFYNIRLFFIQFTRDPPHRQDISIFSNYLMAICRKSVLIGKFPNSLKSIRSF